MDVVDRSRVFRLFVGTVLLFFGMSVGTVAIVASRVHAANARAGGGPVAAAGPSSVMVAATEWKIDPATVQAGSPISVHFMNTGQTTHQIAIEANGKTYTTQVLQAGGTETVNVPALPAGSYKMFCTIPGHRQLGMESTLTVGAGGATASRSPTNMDAMEEAALKAFPAKTQGLGNVPLSPTIVNGVKVFDLTAKAVQWEVTSGQFVSTYAYNGIIPGPAIHANRGDKVKIVLHNTLPESTTIHFHGVTVPNAMDGVPFLTQPPIEPGQTFAYSFTVVDPPGTYMYHSHMNAQFQLSHGLYGAFIIDEPHPAWDTDQIVFLGDGPLGFNINGKGFPATQPIVAKFGQRVHLRFLNAGELLHPMHLHGFHFTVLEQDGQPLRSPYTVDTLVIAPGQTFDVIFTADHLGAWAFHCHILSHAESDHGMYGMVTAVIVAK